MAGGVGVAWLAGGIGFGSRIKQAGPGPGSAARLPGRGQAKDAKEESEKKSFFAVLAVIAWVTAFALVEPAVAWLQERFSMRRLHAAVGCGVAAWMLGAVTVFSFNYWSFSFQFFGAVKKLGAFDVMQILTSHALLPVTGVLFAVFAGWVLKSDQTRAALAFRSPCGYDVWLWSTRLVLPLMLCLLLFYIPWLFA